MYAAVSEELNGKGGLYFNNCFLCEESPLAADKNTAKRLWKITEDLIRNRTEMWYRDVKSQLQIGDKMEKVQISDFGDKMEKKTD